MKSTLEFIALLLLLFLLCVQPIHSLGVPPLYDARAARDSPSRKRGIPPILRRVRNLVAARMRRARPCDPPVSQKPRRMRAALLSQLTACAALLAAVGGLVAGCARHAVARAVRREVEAELRREYDERLRAAVARATRAEAAARARPDELELVDLREREIELEVEASDEPPPRRAPEVGIADEPPRRRAQQPSAALALETAMAAEARARRVAEAELERAQARVAQLERATQELEKAKDDALAEIQRVTSERDRARVDGISVRMDQMVKTDTQGTWM